MNIVGIIPARGGSKRVPRKNIRPLCGRPLVTYSIEQARRSKCISRVIVSTEDKEIARIARKWKAEVIIRPQELARDDTPMIEVIIHVLDSLKKEKYSPDVVVLLQPTSPLRTSQDIDGAIKAFLNCPECLSVVSVTEFDHPPLWAMKVEGKFLKPMFGERYLRMRCQELPPAYRPNGAIFVASPQTLLKYKSFYTPRTLAYFMPPERSIDIDTEFDLLLAEFIISESKNLSETKK